MEVALDEVLNQGKLAEACICYTGDILDDRRVKYNLKYYVDMAKELEKRGTHMTCRVYVSLWLQRSWYQH